MKVPLSWLSEYVLIKLPPKELAERLLLSGTKVEAITKHKEETVLQLEITSNRPDCLSVIGIAREVATIVREHIKLPELPALTRRSHLEKLLITAGDKDCILSYASVLLDRISIHDSPDWLAQRLALCGMRSLNNVVDITNYVMLETGIPLHAFDADKLVGPLNMRLSRANEMLTTLDGNELNLPVGSIVIEDGRKLVDLAGIMGGENSRIDTGTTRVIIHVPIYNSLRIRRTSKALGLRTEAVTRYEKQLDLIAPPFVLRRAVGLLQGLAHARVASEIVEKHPVAYYPPTIKLHLDQVSQILGVRPAIAEIKRILKHLGFTIVAEADGLRVTPPPWRRDVHIPEDIAEELARHIGYHTFPKMLPRGCIPTPSELFTPDYEADIRIFCTRLGFVEHYGSALTSKKLLDAIGAHEYLALANPMSMDFDSLRPNLLVSLLPAVAVNQKYRQSFRLFELGRVFAPSKGPLPDQEKHIGLIMAGGSWREFRGVLDMLLSLCGQEGRATPAAHPLLVPGQSASMNGVGFAGAVHPIVLNAYMATAPVWYGQLPVAALTASLIKSWQVQASSLYPPLKHDLTITVPKNQPIGPLIELMRKTGGSTLASAELISVFGQSFTFRLTFQSRTKTLTEKEGALLEEKINTAVKQFLGH